MTSSAWTRTRSRSGLLQRGQDPDLRARPRGNGPPEQGRKAPDVHDRARLAASGRRKSSSSPSARRRARTGPPTFSTSWASRARLPRAMNGYKVVVNKSTVPVGTAVKVRDVIRRETTHPFSVVSNPEFLKQGAAIDDFMKPDRVVIGAEDPRSAELMKELYAPFTRTGAPIMMMDCAERRAEQVRRQCHAGDAHLVHERSRERLRGGRRERRSGAPRRGVRSAHRAVVPLSGRRLRRELFPEGRQGDGALRRGQGLRLPGFCAPSRPSTKARRARLVTKMEAHFGSLKGKRIALWGLAFKPKTDDMREAPAVPLVQGLLAAGATVHAYDPEAMKVATRHLRIEDSIRRHQLCGADRRRRAGDHHRVERVPGARLRPHAEADAQPGHLRRAQHLQPREPARARVHLHLDGPSVSAVLVTGGAGYIGSHAVEGAARARRDGHRLRQFQPGPPRGHARTRPRSSRATSRTPRSSSRRIKAHDVDAVMHFAAWLSVGDSVKDPAGYYRNNVGRGAVGARRDGGERRPAPGVLVDVRRSSARLRRRRSTRICRSARSTPTARRSWRSSTRCRISRSPTACAASRCATSTPPAPIPTASSARIMRRRFTSSRARSTRRWAAARSVIFGDDYPTPDGTCLRDYVHVNDLASAHLLALDALRAGAPSNAYNLGNGRPTSVRDVLASVERVTGTRVPYELAPRREGDPAALFASSDRARRELGWRPALRGSRRHRRDRVALARSRTRTATPR